MRTIVSALAVAVLFTGLSQAAPVSKPVANASKVLPDAQIERNIKAKFGKSKINAEHFTVSVQNGVATIEGKTSVIQHKGVATRLAKTGGAVAVQNHIQISDAAKAKAAAKLAQYRPGEGPPVRATVIQPGSNQVSANQVSSNQTSTTQPKQ
ncbi:MAG TPA: BON domain-containing protein [Bryobacteraceae bacterium]|nr:BON domain-containing protein [Bryobacteraceae bacterium]